MNPEHKKWTEEELDIIRKYGVKERVKELHKRLPNRTIMSISNRRGILGVKRALKASPNSGKMVRKGNYVTIKIDGKYEGVHRLVMEKHIGRKLKADERAHHIDGNGFNNNIDNLYLCNKENHAGIHGTFLRLFKQLFKDGVIYFDREKGAYIYNRR